MYARSRKYFAVAQRVVAILVVLVAVCGTPSESKCKFQAIFNFGDSNSDTGGFWAAFPSTPSPNGMTYFNKEIGRASNGRLVIDFLAQGLGLRFLDPYLRSIGTNFTHGANFATLGSTVLQPKTSVFVSGVSPFYLDVQVNQMKAFKSIIDNQNSVHDNLPASDVFGKSLYTIYIGQSDFTAVLASKGILGVQKYIPNMTSKISKAIKDLYMLGGRTLMVFNMAPIGCYPAFLVNLPHQSSVIDKYGCMISYNNAVVDYNNKLKEALSQTRASLKDASIIYVDIHSILLEFFQNPTNHWFKYTTKACCGSGGGSYNFNPRAFCGTSKQMKGRNLTAAACSDPDRYISWDGIHTTEAANRLITTSLLIESFFDPPFPLNELCDIQPIG